MLMQSQGPTLTLTRNWSIERLRQPKKPIKVPEISSSFWVIKLMTTAMGEAASDFLVFHTNPYLAVVGAGLVLLAALFIQISAKRYIASLYWFAVSMVAVAGTMAADVLHVVMHVPYEATSALFAIVLGIVFYWWRKSEGTLSIHTITNRRRELFYWATVMSTFALGTSVGDMTATNLGLGYLTSGWLFLGLFMLSGILYKFFDVNEVFCFWLAYILTRPIGASFADWFGVGRPAGLGFGRGSVALVLLLCIVLLVTMLSFKQSRSRRPIYRRRVVK